MVLNNWKAYLFSDAKRLRLFEADSCNERPLSLSPSSVHSHTSSREEFSNSEKGSPDREKGENSQSDLSQSPDPLTQVPKSDENEHTDLMTSKDGKSTETDESSDQQKSGNT